MGHLYPPFNFVSNAVKPSVVTAKYSIAFAALYQKYLPQSYSLYGAQSYLVLSPGKTLALKLAYYVSISLS